MRGDQALSFAGAEFDMPSKSPREVASTHFSMAVVQRLVNTLANE